MKKLDLRYFHMIASLLGMIVAVYFISQLHIHYEWAFIYFQLDRSKFCVWNKREDQVVYSVALSCLVPPQASSSVSAFWSR